MNKICNNILLLSFTIMLMFVNSLNAQQTNTKQITGKIVEKGKGSPIEYATIALYTPNKEIIKGTTSAADGSFILDLSSSFKPQNDNYILQISFIGYISKEYKIDFNLSGSKSYCLEDLLSIELEANSEVLKGTVVSAKQALIEQKMGKIIMNVSESVFAKSSNGFDLIKKAPGISVDIDGNLTLNGQLVEVWIDDRPSRLNGANLKTLLSALSGTSIEKFEILQHPSAKYDAQGSGGIINIKTKKNFAQGLYGNVTLNYTAIPYNKYGNELSASVNLNYRNKKSNYYLIYSPSYSDEYVSVNSNTLFGRNYSLRQDSHSMFIGDGTTHLIKGGTDINLNEKNVIGLLLGTNINNYVSNSNDSHTTTFNNTTNKEIEHSKTTINTPGHFKSIDANAYYTYKFNNASDISVNFDYNYFDLARNNYQSNKYFLPDNLLSYNQIAFLTNSSQYINIYAVKADYKQPIFKKGMLEAGAKWSRTNTNNNLEHRDSLDYKYVINHEKSTYFNYSEDIIAAYASLSYQFNNKWSSMLGIRAEYTDSYGDWISSKTTSKQKYVNFFPNLYIGYAPNKNWRLSAFYSLRINRPKFGQLNPYTIYIDANSIIVGNPNLKPQHTTDLSLNVGFKNFLNITFVSQITSSLISQIPSFDNVTGAKTLKWENFGKLYLSGGQISITEFELFKDYLYISASAFMSQAKNISNLDNYNTSSFFQQYNGTISLLLPKDLKIEVSTNYMGKLPYGYMQVEPGWTLDAGIKIDLFKKKATLSLNVNDILRTGETKIKMHDGDILNYYISQQLYTQRIKLGFIYNFGKLSAPRRTAKRDDTSSRVSK